MGKVPDGQGPQSQGAQGSVCRSAGQGWGTSQGTKREETGKGGRQCPLRQPQAQASIVLGNGALVAFTYLVTDTILQPPLQQAWSRDQGTAKVALPHGCFPLLPAFSFCTGRKTKTAIIAGAYAATDGRKGAARIRVQREQSTHPREMEEASDTQAQEHHAQALIREIHRTDLQLTLKGEAERQDAVPAQK